MSAIQKVDLLRAIETIPHDLWDEFIKDNNREIRDMLLLSRGEYHTSRSTFKIAMNLMELVNGIDELELLVHENPCRDDLKMALASKKDDLEKEFTNFEDKIDSFGSVLKMLDKDANKWTHMADIFAAKKKITENQIKTIRTRISEIMKAMGLEAVKGRYFTAKFSKPTKTVVIDDVSEEFIKRLPPEFQTIKYSLNKAAVKDAVERGDFIEFAHVDYKQSFRIT